MNNYLEKSKYSLAKFNKYDRIYVVLGNETCDLDSAASALIYAYFLSNLYETNIAVIPVLNIDEEEFPLRTETKYFFEKLCVSIDKLVFKNQINLSDLSSQNKLRLILVDHHVLSPKDKYLSKDVIEIIDHRPVDPTVNWENANKTIEPVGSCATLVANKILEKRSDLFDELITTLLHGTIILDTINFNKDAKRFTQLDLETVSILEQKYSITNTRAQIFNELVAARNDVSTLSPFQILHRDMKIVHGVPLPGVPMLVVDFLRLPDSENALKHFCYAKKSKVIVVMGLQATDGQVYRDIGVFTLKESDFKTNIVNCLKNTQDLKLTEMDTDVDGLTLFSQGNVNSSRKQIIPVLNDILKEHLSHNTL